LYQHPARACCVEPVTQHSERTRAETPGQAMDLDAGLCRLVARCRGGPYVNTVAMRGKPERDQPRVIGDATLLRRILGADDVPGGQASSLPRVERRVREARDPLTATAALNLSIR
jgi:hypothetical protein